MERPKQYIAEQEAYPAAGIVVGLLTITTDMVSEQEVRAFLPGITICANRLKMSPQLSIANLSAMEDELANCAADILPGENVSVFNFSCTSGAAVIGPEKIAAAIMSVRPGSLVTDPVTAAVAAMKAMSLSRVAFLTPYTELVHAAMERHLTDQGIDINASGAFGLDRDEQVRRVSSGSIVNAARDLDGPNIDGIFISCTALRCHHLIDQLEQVLGKPVITSNQAAAWHIMQLLGLKTGNGPGKLLRGA